MDLIYIAFTCYARDNQQECFSLAIDSSCDVWGHGLATCLLCNGPIFRFFVSIFTRLSLFPRVLSSWKTDWTNFHGPPLYRIYMLCSGWSAGVFQLSNWFSLRCLGPWIGHLPPMYWSNFTCFVSLRKLVCKFGIMDRDFLYIFSFYYCLWTLPKFYLYHSSHMVSLWNSFVILSTGYYHFP